MEFKYECIIIGGIIKKIQIEFMYGGSPSCSAKTARYRTIIDLEG